MPITGRPAHVPYHLPGFLCDHRQGLVDGMCGGQGRVEVSARSGGHTRGGGTGAVLGNRIP